MAKPTSPPSRASRDRTGTGGIQNLGVIPAYRGKGLGLALLLQALHGFRRSVWPRRRSKSPPRTSTAIHMYRRFGFRFRKTLYRLSRLATYRLEPLLPEWVV